MNDLLVLTSFEALRCERLRLERSDADLNEKLRLRGVLLKREEVSNRKQLATLLARVHMLQCESECLEVLLRDDRAEAARMDARIETAVSESRRAANDRKEFNGRLAAAIRNFSLQAGQPDSRAFPLFTSEADKLDAIVQNYAELVVVRAAVESSPTRHAEALRRLEESAREGRERHMAEATDLSRTAHDLKAHIAEQRLRLRHLYAPDDAHCLMCWAESVGKKARCRVRWDLMHPVCMLEVVMLEGLRLT
jgi:23S rRNA G2069 N7-methylase RlmK/C1962 C5-methylase RlmI